MSKSLGNFMLAQGRAGEPIPRRSCGCSCCRPTTAARSTSRPTVSTRPRSRGTGSRTSSRTCRWMRGMPPTGSGADAAGRATAWRPRVDDATDKFESEMDDDFNTAGALGRGLRARARRQRLPRRQRRARCPPSDHDVLDRPPRSRSSSCSASSGSSLAADRGVRRGYPAEVLELARRLAGYDGRRPRDGRRCAAQGPRGGPDREELGAGRRGPRRSDAPGLRHRGHRAAARVRSRDPDAVGDVTRAMADRSASRGATPSRSCWRAGRRVIRCVLAGRVANRAMRSTTSARGASVPASPSRRVPRRALDRESERGAHQGVIAFAAAVPYTPLDGRPRTPRAIASRAPDHRARPRHGPGQPRRGRAHGRRRRARRRCSSPRTALGVDDASALKAAAGAAEHLPVCREPNLVRALDAAKAGRLLGGRRERARAGSPVGRGAAGPDAARPRRGGHRPRPADRADCDLLVRVPSPVTSARSTCPPPPRCSPSSGPAAFATRVRGVSGDRAAGRRPRGRRLQPHLLAYERTPRSWHVDPAVAQARLVDAIASYAGAEWDADRRLRRRRPIPRPTATPSTMAGVTVVYSPFGVDADSVVETLSSGSARRGEAVRVVTSDAETRHTVAAHAPGDVGAAPSMSELEDAADEAARDPRGVRVAAPVDGPLTPSRPCNPVNDARWP